MNQENDEFKSKVMFVLAHLPEGEVISYGELANQAGSKQHACLVGRILKQLPTDTALPWFRVINSKKQISFNEGSEAYQRQRAALEAEGWIIAGQRLIAREAP